VRDKIQDQQGGYNYSLTGITFDEKKKSADAVISEQGYMLGSTAKDAYGMLNCCMETGTWEWTMTIVKDNRWDETSCLGVCSPDMTNHKYESSTEMWLIRCYNGELYHGGKIGRQTSKIHPGDVCVFTYDAGERKLFLSLNGTPKTLLFDDVGKGVSPFVLFYGNARTVRFAGMKRQGGANGHTTAKIEWLDVIETEESIVKDLEDATIPLCTTVIHRVGQLAKVISLAIQHDNNGWVNGQGIDHPYCLQLDRKVYAGIMNLLVDVPGQPQSLSTMPAFKTGVLNVMDVHLRCLLNSAVEPAELGFVDPASTFEWSTKQNAMGDPLFAATGSVLMRLAKQMDGPCSAVEQVYAGGFPLFLPCISERIEAVIHTLAEYRSIVRDLTGDTRTNALQRLRIVLDALLKHMSSYAEVLKVKYLYEKEPMWRPLVRKLVEELLVITEATSGSGADDDSEVLFSSGAGTVCEADHVFSFLSRLQENIVYDLANASTLQTSSPTRAAAKQLACVELSRFLVHYADALYKLALKVLAQYSQWADMVANADEGRRPALAMDRFLAESAIGKLLLPLLHGLCLCCDHQVLCQGTLPGLMNFVKEAAVVCGSHPECLRASRNLGRLMDSSVPSFSCDDSGEAGWHVMKNVCFREEEALYSISENGSMYVATQSTNTCAVTNCKFSGKVRAAWEFLLVADSASDECSVFGCARIPLRSRCYSTSTDLWMRRAYNGYLYACGRSVGQSLEKVHAGDIVRVEFDGVAGTISYGLNGSEPEIAFTDVQGEVSPCCGSYRVGVQVRLLKVETFGNALSADDDVRQLAETQFVLDEALRAKDLSSIVLPVPKDSKKEAESCLTARGDKGVSSGIHEWTFEVQEHTSSTFAVGIVMQTRADSQAIPYKDDLLAGECLIDDPDPSGKDREQKDKQKDGEREENLSVDEVSRGTSDTILTYATATMNNVEREQEKDGGDNNHGVQGKKKVPALDYSSAGFTAFAWHSNGSLWVDGESQGGRCLVRAQIHNAPKFVPVEKHSSISFRLDCDEGILDLYFDGAFAGRAFTCMVPKSTDDCSASPFRPVFYPAASVSGPQNLRLRETGFMGSVVMPQSTVLTTTAASTFGRLSAELLRGEVIDDEERSLLDWVRSPMLIGGFDAKASDATAALSSLTDGVAAMDVDDLSRCTNDANRTSSSSSGVRRSYTLSFTAQSASLVVPGDLLAATGGTGAVVGASCVVEDLVGGRAVHTFTVSEAVRLSPFPSWSLSAPADEYCCEMGDPCDVALHFSVWVDVPGKDRRELAHCDVPLTDLCSCLDGVPFIALGARLPLKDAGVLCYNVQVSQVLVEAAVADDAASVAIPQHVFVSEPSTALGPVEETEASLLSTLACTTVVEGSRVSALFDWLDEIGPVNATMKKTFLKLKSYHFPQVEMPYLASLVKHLGLDGELVEAFIALKNGETPAGPSLRMTSMWSKVRQQRDYLRKKRQDYKQRAMAASDDSPGGVTGPDESVLGRASPMSTDEVVGTVVADADGDSGSGGGDAASSTSERTVTQELQASLESGSIVWHAQPVSCKSVFTARPQYCCQVLSVGVDMVNEYVYLKVNISTDGQLGAIQEPERSKLWVDVQELTQVKFIPSVGHEATEDDMRGCLRYDACLLPSMSQVSIESVSFQFGENGYSKALLSINVQDNEEEVDVAESGQAQAATGRVESAATIKDGDAGKEAKDEGPPTFDALCSIMRKNALFLLELNPACSDGPGSVDSYRALIDMTMGRSGLGSLACSPSYMRTMSLRSEGGGGPRWQRVVDFLKSHSRVGRERSVGSLGGGTFDGLERVLSSGPGAPGGLTRNSSILTDFTAEGGGGASSEMGRLQETVVQGCHVFMLGQEAVGADALRALLRKRERRAKARQLALSTLSALMECPHVSADSNIIDEVLLLVRPALKSSPVSGNGASTFHYLANLEGCNPPTMAAVQGAFIALYSAMSRSTAHCLACVALQDDDLVGHVPTTVARVGAAGASEATVLVGGAHAHVHVPVPRPRAAPRAASTLKILLSSWSLHYSNRDHGFLLQSGLLPCLFKIMSVATAEAAVRQWMSAGIKVARYYQRHARTHRRAFAWRSWSSAKVIEGLRSSHLSCRSVLLLLLQMPSNIRPEDASGKSMWRAVTKNLEWLCANLSASEVVRHIHHSDTSSHLPHTSLTPFECSL
jgi:hypothetical protein